MGLRGMRSHEVLTNIKIMAEIEIITQKKVLPFHKIITLEAGQKLTDIPEILVFAQKTVPAGYRAKVNVLIMINIETL